MLIIISVVTCDHRDLEPLNRYAVTTPFLISSLWLTCVSHNIFHIGVYYNAITLMRYNITLKFTANHIFNIDEIFHFKNDSCIEILIEYTT